MTIISVITKSLNCQNYFPLLVGSCDQTNFIPKLIRLMRFPFGNTIGTRFVNTVNLVFVLSFLSNDAFKNIALLSVVLSLIIAKITFQFPNQSSGNRF